MRDLETMRMALTAAETGLLVFATLHTNSAAKAVDRIIDAFPAEEQEQVRIVLAEALRGVVAQQLLRKKGGGRAPAFEILLGSTALSNAIREGKTSLINNQIQTGKRKGMISMDQSLTELVKSGVVEPDEALERALDKETFKATDREPPEGTAADASPARRQPQREDRSAARPRPRPRPFRRAARRCAPRSPGRSPSPSGLDE